MIRAFAGGNIWLELLLKLAMAGAFYLGGISVLAMFAIWWERKVAGHMQSRLGPMHVGVWHGWAQSIADGVKLLLKEDLMPDGVDALLFRLAPYLAFAPVFAAFMALPFSPQFIFEGRLNIGVLYLLAVLAVEVMGVILAGWASNSKWSIYGAMREACQMVSYEIPLGVSILCGVLVAGTLDLVELNYLQGRGLTSWFIFHNPFIFAAFLVYFIASLAENKRAPFDLPESESELVAGFHTEYSGLRWSFFFFAEYGAMFVVGGIQAALFLGGWNSPLGTWDPVYHFIIHYNPVQAGQLYFSGALSTDTIAPATGWLGQALAIWHAKAQAFGLSDWGLLVLNLYSMGWFIVKAMTVMFVQIWLRWTLPRIRIDQVLHACVKVLLPASLALFLGVALWVYLVPQPEPAKVAYTGAAAALYGASGQITRLGHLMSPTPWLQWITQLALTLVGLALVAGCLGVVIHGFRTRHTLHQSLFTDVLPVGNQIAFTKGPVPAESEPAPATPPAAPTPAA